VLVKSKTNPIVEKKAWHTGFKDFKYRKKDADLSEMQEKISLFYYSG